MALVPVRITRTSKPPVGTPIDWGNPLTQGLVGAWAFNEGGGRSAFNAVNGLVGTLGTTEQLTNRGLTNDATVNTGGAFSPSPSWMVNNCPYSFITEVSMIATGSFNVIGGFVAGSAGFVLWGNSAGAITLKHSGLTTDRLATSNSIPQITNNTPVKIAAIFDGANRLIYTDGKLKSSASTTGTYVAPTTAFGLGGTNGGNLNGMNGCMNYSYLYSRALSPTEIASLSANPWQIYQPEITWVTVGGGVESFTGTYAAIQAAQSQSLAAALAFTGYSAQSQVVQSQIISALLQFSGSTAQMQRANTEALSAALSFSGTSEQSQSRQSESLAASLGYFGAIAQAQAHQAQAIFQALLAITGSVSQSQAAQIATLTASLAFGGVSAQVQAAQSEALAAVLSFTGATAEIQQVQTETLAALLAFGGNISQAQAIQIETLQAILAFGGSVDQTQAQQRQIILEFIAAVILNFGFILPPETKGFTLPMETKGLTLPVEVKGYTL